MQREKPEMVLPVARKGVDREVRERFARWLWYYVGLLRLESDAAIARQLGVAPATITNIRRHPEEHRPGFDVALAMHRKWGVQMDVLLHGEPPGTATSPAEEQEQVRAELDRAMDMSARLMSRLLALSNASAAERRRSTLDSLDAASQRAMRKAAEMLATYRGGPGAPPDPIAAEPVAPPARRKRSGQ
jgi:hypothetical protein